MDAATITSWMHEIDTSVRAERDHLVQLDAAIGDLEVVAGRERLHALEVGALHARAEEREEEILKVQRV